MSFVHLHSHSFFSFYRGVNSVKDLVQRAKTLGIKALALTDTDRMSGLIQFYLECRENGIKPILGVELTEPDKPYEYIVLLAKNSSGYGDICELVTKRHLEKDSFSFAELCSQQWPNLFFLTNFPHLLKLVYYSPNRNSLFGELVNNSKTTRNRSRAIDQLCLQLGIPVTISNNFFFLNKEDWQTHKVLCAIGLISTISRLKSAEFVSKDSYFKTQKEMQQLFPRHKQAMENTEKIAQSCNVLLSLGNWILPEISVPKSYTPKSYLNKLANQGLYKNYGNTPLFNKAKEIQQTELKVIEKLGYPSYFLMVKQIRDWANNTLRSGYRKPKDCTILRGSAANSITFYNLGVSDLDPIKYDLYFQRFLNEDRASPPDADLDFGWDERDEVLDYISETWGQDRVAMVCTTNHFRYRAAFRETAKVYGYSDEQISKILKSWKTLSRRIADEEISFLVKTADKICGKPRFLGQHPGGVLITNDPIWRHVACENSGGIKNRIITQIDMHNGIDELGLIKFDILGNGSISVLRDVLKQLHKQGLADPEVWNLQKCFSDSKVQQVISNGRTKGVFYIESPAQTKLNKKIRAKTFEEVTITSSLVRPAGARYTKVFVERHRKMKAGIKDWDFLHKSLEPILSTTHDVCAFQEDVTKICHNIAGLSYKKADKIRKMMNSLHEGVLSSQEYKTAAREFINGSMEKNGLTRDQALTLWERVSSFTGFSFCKSHSASYAQLSFKCSYLKTYYPSQFFSAVISNKHGFYSREVYLDEAQRWGIRILPININESNEAYIGKHNWIRPGFMHIRNLSKTSIENIVQEREKNGKYKNLINFLQRVAVYRKEAENLLLVGAFDGFGLSRPESLFLLDGIHDTLKKSDPRLFPFNAESASLKLHPGMSDYNFMEKCLTELHLLGYMISGNIIDILHLHPASSDAVPAKDIPYFKGKRIKIFGRKITERTHHIQKSGKLMKFVTIEDKTECIDVIFWPKNYEIHSDILLEDGPFEIWGTVSEEWGSYTLAADYIKAVKWFPGHVDFTLASKLLEQSIQRNYTYEDIPVIRVG